MRELALIVTGVLIALAAQSWWENRREGAREFINLRLLLATTLDNERRILEAIQDDSRYQDAADRLLEYVRTARAGEFPDTLRPYLIRAGSFSQFHPLTGLYTSVANSGDIGAMGDDSLRAAIVSLAGEIVGRSEEMRLFDDLGIRIGEQLAGYVDVPGILLTDMGGGGLRWTTSDSAPGFEAEWSRRRSSLDFHNVLFLAWLNERNRVRLLTELLQSVQSLRSRLEAAIGTRSP